MQGPAGDPLSFDDDGAERGRSFGSPLEWAQLMAGAARRRWPLALLVFLLVMAAVAAYYRMKPASYRVEAKILAQSPPAMMSAVRGDEVAPRSAWELIHRRDNLVALAEQAGLLQAEAVEPGSGTIRRALLLLRPQEGQRKEEPIDVVVRALDKELLVSVEGGTIQIRLDWPNAQHAYTVVAAAVQSFLEARHLQEVSSMDQVIAQMDGRMASLKAELDAAIAAAQRKPTAVPRAPAPKEHLPSEELARLRSLAEAKERAARDVEEFRSRRIAELESQLTQARATLSDLHPTVVGLRRDIESLSHESPQLRELREDERKVRAQYTALLAKEGNPSSVGRSAEAVIVDTSGQHEEDPRVRDLRLQYEQLAARVTSAHVDLDATRAAFKYRYDVIWPPEIPAEPYSPKPAKVFGIGFAAALVLAFLAAVLPDLLSGRIVQRWQVERELNLPVLAETRSSRRRPR